MESQSHVKEPFVLAAAGDAIITRRLTPYAGRGGAFDEVVSAIRDADAAVANLEVLVHDYEGYPAATSGGTYMRAPPVVLDELVNVIDRARARGRTGAPHGTFVVATTQTAARGRDGADWSAPRGGVWSSFLVRPTLDLDRVGGLTIAGGLAALDTVADFGVDARLKWPNDVVVAAADGSQRKLAGVLTELVVDEVPIAGKPVETALPNAADRDLQFALLGIGINADLDPDELDTTRSVTTMRAELGQPVDPTDVAITLHHHLMERTAQVETDDGFADLLADWRAHTVTLGEPVRVTRHEGTVVTGTASELTEIGALVVETATGPVTVTEGEVERLRRQ
jgi:BirA family biotin operon repressor/biotin-[acetyl-CoA-carboxylase] ligase